MPRRRRRGSLNDCLHDPRLITASLAELLVLVVSVALAAPTLSMPRRPRPHRRRVRTGMKIDALPRRILDMPFNPAPRGSSVVASVMTAGLMVMTAGIMVILASCASQQTPPRQTQQTPPRQTPRAAGSAVAGPRPVAAMSRPPRLRSPFILDAVRIQPPTPGGGCPAGSVALSGGPGQCYRNAGTPLTITHAAVSSIFSYRLPHPPGQKASPTVYGFVITLPAADHAALTAVLTAAVNSHGHLDISIAGRTWLIPTLRSDLTGQLEIAFRSKNLVLQLQSLLDPSS